MATYKWSWLLMLIMIHSIAGLPNIWPVTTSSEVNVFNQQELVDALHDESIDRIMMKSPTWNFTDEKLPYRAGVVRGKERTVTIEGAALKNGDIVYIDGNRLVSRVFVTDGATLLQRNFWVDDCISPTLDKFPFTCFAEASGGGARLELRDAIMSDAGCTSIDDSAGIHAIVGIIGITKSLASTITRIDERTVHIGDTNWIAYVPPTASWRFVNVTLSCTGNVTHELPPNDTKIIRLLSHGQLAILVTTVAGVVALLFTLLTRSSNKLPPEHVLALSKGYELLERLGQGRSGWVYRAKHIESQRIVAIKVMMMRSTDADRLRLAYRECTMNASIKHPSCVRVITFYSEALTQEIHSESEGSDLDSEGDDGNINSETSNFDAINLSPGLNEHKESEPLLPATSTTAQSTQSSTSENSISNGNNTNRLAYGLQVHLVMEYADLGTLDEGVHSGRFQMNGKAHLPTILATSLDIAEGLAALHDPMIRFVHRDLSPNNVLLTSDANKRGFRAVLSDFGLSTVLASGATHRTSQAKGTLTYMGPELITSDAVSPALDCYSFGVVLMFMLLQGENPYGKWSQARILNHKLMAGDEGQVPVPFFLKQAALTDPILAACLNLILECTRADRKMRMDAPRIVSELNTILRHID